MSLLLLKASCRSACLLLLPPGQGSNVECVYLKGVGYQGTTMGVRNGSPVVLLDWPALIHSLLSQQQCFSLTTPPVAGGVRVALSWPIEHRRGYQEAIPAAVSRACTPCVGYRVCGMQYPVPPSCSLTFFRRLRMFSGFLETRNVLGRGLAGTCFAAEDCPAPLICFLRLAHR